MKISKTDYAKVKKLVLDYDADTICAAAKQVAQEENLDGSRYSEYVDNLIVMKEKGQTVGFWAGDDWKFEKVARELERQVESGEYDYLYLLRVLVIFDRITGKSTQEVIERLNFEHHKYAGGGLDLRLKSVPFSKKDIPKVIVP